MINRLRTRFMKVLSRVILFVPWVILLALTTILLIDPGMIQTLALDVNNTSVVVRGVILLLLYGGLAGGIYMRNREIFDSLLKRGDHAASASSSNVAQASASSVDAQPRTASVMERMTRRENPEQGATPPQAAKESSAAKSTSNDESMSEDDFYSFLESTVDTDKEQQS